VFVNFPCVLIARKPPILKEISICKLEDSSRLHWDNKLGCRRLLFTSDFQIEISFKIDFFY